MSPEPRLATLDYVADVAKDWVVSSFATAKSGAFSLTPHRFEFDGLTVRRRRLQRSSPEAADPFGSMERSPTPVVWARSGMNQSRNNLAARFDRMWARILRRRMRAHPVPTFVFADLVGYTALTEELGDEAAAAIAREFGRTMRELSRKHGARQVKSMGDGVMIWAPDAEDAVALAADAVDNVAGSPPVRVGVHTGRAVLRGSDWYGSAVNVAARLADQARPGEALISGATHSAARGRLMYPLRARRELALRGIERPVVAWTLS